MVCRSEKALLPVTIRRRVLLLQTIEALYLDHVRMYVMPCRIIWIIFTLDLVLTYTDESLVFRCGQIGSSCSWFVFILR